MSLPLLKIEAKDVGKAFKIRIGHDGSGVGSGWFLDTVEVRHLAMAAVPKEKKKEDKKKKKKKKKDEDEEEEGEEMQEVVVTYRFPCSRWLARGEADGELQVELLPDGAEELEGKTITPVKRFPPLYSGALRTSDPTFDDTWISISVDSRRRPLAKMAAPCVG